MDLQGRTIFVTGASRGIGKAIALRAARDGANVVLAAKSTKPHRVLPGTLPEAAAEVEAAGGRALVCRCDVRDEASIAAAVHDAVDAFGGIDVLVNNAGALFLAATADTPMRRFDLVHQVNVRATFACTQACLPHLEKSANPHVLNLCPPLSSLQARWLAPHLAYSLSKFGMSLCVLGMAEELRDRRIAVNALWPRTTIATAAIENVLGGEAMMRRSRHATIMADAAHAIVTRDSTACTGNFFLDEDVLRETGVEDFTPYAVDPDASLQPDLFV